MYFKYGDHQHPDNEVTIVSFRKRRRLSQRGWSKSLIYSMELHGELDASTQSNLKDKIEELEAAYANDGLDAVFYHDDDTASPYKIISSDTMSGTIIRDLQFPYGMEPEEYATQIKFRIVIEAEAKYSEKQILYFIETLQFLGNCGPRWKSVECAWGPPIVQLVSEQTVQKIIQEGRSMGLDGYPLYPGPLWPLLEHQHLRRVQLIGPKEWRNDRIEYGVRWRYVFSSGVPLAGAPHVGWWG